MNPETKAVWHMDSNGDVVEPCETESDVGESYTNWKEN